MIDPFSKDIFSEFNNDILKNSVIDTIHEDLLTESQTKNIQGAVARGALQGLLQGTGLIPDYTTQLEIKENNAIGLELRDDGTGDPIDRLTTELEKIDGTNLAGADEIPDVENKLEFDGDSLTEIDTARQDHSKLPVGNVLITPTATENDIEVDVSVETEDLNAARSVDNSKIPSSNLLEEGPTALNNDISNALKLDTTLSDDSDSKEHYLADPLVEGNEKPTFNKLLLTSANTTISQLKDELNTTRTSEIGYVYVNPLKGSGVDNFWIPLEFMPVISESGVTAKYKDMEVLGRIGNLKTYLNTSGMSLTMEAKYLVTSDGSDSITSLPNSSWMNEFTEAKCAAIEAAYRSLVSPQFLTASKTTYDGSTYIRPPVVKLVLGSKNNVDNLGEDNGVPYQGLITKTIENVNNDKFIRRPFIVTSVNVRRDFFGDNIRISNQGNINTHSFTISLQLVEVTSNYYSIMPDFFTQYKSYSNTLSEIAI